MSENEKIIPVNIEEEMKDSYLDYAMSVIVARALPDVRDGLKPVHRRVLYAMNDLGLQFNRTYKKSARIVGEVLGKYHPHGDTAVYDTMVRMVQVFSLRYPLVDGQGNFGSVDGDSPAAMRYTEARLARVSSEMLRDIEKNTVDFVSNFDDTLQEPSVLPANFPNLLVNGASGIAVGMATNIPPHNLNEVVDSCIAFIDDPNIEIKKLMKLLKGPDFPTGAIIYGAEGIRDAYETGRGRINIRARVKTEELNSGKQSIVISEIPYQVNKANLIEKIADLTKEKKIEGISDIRDESDRDGMRVVIELRRDAVPEVILNNLYKHTQMSTTFGMIMLALVKGEPKILNLRQMIQNFIEHRHEVVVRRAKFDLEEAEKRAHILEGLKKAIDIIDQIIALIKKSKDVDEARKGLIAKWKFSEVQAQAILDMTLKRLTNLERKKIEDELKELYSFIKKLKSLLDSRKLRMELIKEELAKLKQDYGDERRTEIIAEAHKELTIEDMIAEEDMVITISHDGFIKRFPVSGYRRQGRGGRGSTGAVTKEEDFVEHLFIATTHQYILFFTHTGRCYWLKVHEIPQGGKATKGRAIVNLINIKKEEKIMAFVSVKDFDDKHYVAMVTQKGVAKKTKLSAFGNQRKDGILAMKIDEKKDHLVVARLTDGTEFVIIGTKEGMAICFPEKELRDMGRIASGVRGIKLGKNDEVVGMVNAKKNATLLVVSENGYGKRSKVSDYRITRRGGKGVRTFKISNKTGKLVSIRDVIDEDDMMITTENGVIIRLHVKDLRVMSRNTQGVRLIKVDPNDKVSDIARIVFVEGTEGE